MSATNDSTTALLLIAHGSRRAEANDDLEHVARQIRHGKRYGFVQSAYLELAEPSIAEGGKRCVEGGVKRVILLPYFLSPGMHVRKDLKAARDELVGRFPHVEFSLAEPLGRHPLLVEIVLQRAAEASVLE